MPSSIANLISNLNRYGIARTNRFYVNITPPSSMASMGGDVGRLLRVSCESAKIPGMNIDSEDYRTYDLPWKIAKDRKFDDNLDLTFRVDENFVILDYFKKWMDTIYDPTTGDVGYYDDYKGTVALSVLDRAGGEVLAVKFNDAYPASFSSIDVDWNNENDYAKLNVSFVYRSAEYEAQHSGLTTSNATNAVTQAQSMLQGNLTNTNGKLEALTGKLNKLL